MDEINSFCSGCLKNEEPANLLQYTEKNRRLFHYSTSVQVKKSINFPFQLCKECYLNMKLACKFKKQCRNSDKQIKSYLAVKATGEDLDFCTFLKNNDNCSPFRFPMLGNSTPFNQQKDDDEESTGTSICNFMSDMLKDQEIPDTEAQIISEVLEEQADSCDDSLDSHWLQDDVSIDTNFRLDFSFSPFNTPRNNIQRSYSPNKIDEPHEYQFEDNNVNIETLAGEVEKTVKSIEYHIEDAKSVNSDKDSISRRIDLALENDEVQEIPLENLLASPRVIPGVHAPLTPTINNILFGEKIDLDENSNSNIPKPGQVIETYQNVNGNLDFIEEFFNKDATREATSKDDKQDNENNTTAQIIDEIDSLTQAKEKTIVLLEDVKYDLNKYECLTCSKKLKEFDRMKQHLKEIHNIALDFKVPKPKPKRVCEVCGESFANIDIFRKHKKKHMVPRKFACPHCKVQYLSKVTLQIHMASSHKQTTIKREFVCKICQLAVYSMLELYQHQATHKETYDCDKCEKKFYMKNDLIKHMKQHERQLQCSLCPKTFFQLRRLTYHMRIHESAGTFKCDICKKTYSTKINLNRHISRSKKCRIKRNLPFADQIQQAKDQLAEFITIG